MKKRHLNVIIALILCLSLVGMTFATGTTASAQEGTGTISGTVYEADGVTPIYNVHIQAYDATTGEHSSSTDTDSSGNYTLADLPVGSYLVQAEASWYGLGYANEYYDNVYTRDEATPVPVTVSQDTPNINFSLGPGGTISGTVYESDNSTPIANVHMHAYDTTTGEHISCRDTDSSGNYTLAGLVGGSYLVQANASRNGLPYATEYYDNVYARDEATSVPVTVSQDTPNINFSLGPDGTISGTVYEADGVTPIANVRMKAYDAATEEGFGSTDTDSSGNYTLAGLPGGNYLVQAEASYHGLPYANEWYNNVYVRDEATPVPVTVSQDTLINFSLEPGGSISGNVNYFDGENFVPIADARVHADDYTTGQRMERIHTDASGNYTLVVPTGSYKVYIHAYDTGLPYATEYYNNKYIKNNADPVTVTAEVNTPDINFTLELGGTISGTVYEADGVTPIYNVNMQAYDATTEEVFVSTDTDSSGNYTLAGLPDGSYLIRARASSHDLPYADEYYDNVYTRDEATPVPVTVSQDTLINFSLGPGGTISGTVYEADEVTPIYDVRMQAYDATTGAGISTSKDTDSSGNYTLTGLPGGSYLVRARASYHGLPYADEYYDNVYIRDEATPVSVTVSQDTPNINFSLGPGGTISGTVYESDNTTPIYNVRMQVYDATTEEYFTSTDTDASGNYTLAGLSGGSYLVKAEASYRGLPYANEYYDNV
ncbi:carboxypeptidase regulatory-like domain-containing protein, partial [Chloroflexota bacterium]